MMENAGVNVVHAVTRAISTGSFRQFNVPGTNAIKLKVPSREKLIKIARESHQVLFKANTVFPFNFFPDTIIMDREKLTIANRLFYRVAKVVSLPIRDILSVEASVGPLFGAVHMTSRYYPVNPYSINFLWRSDAIKLRQLLQGYIIAYEREVDCADIDKQSLIRLLTNLGSGDIS